ncbi:AAA family ATPase [Devosia sp. RR2S18]|uniref:AAA family ATPase n=1 Tax=Devosia rhizosphaerae TaxID=3049774 RepID=UPI0025419F45|nr:AAA family ATPase [Devosia sp. RR2S18]WIJ23990.1 AAA family ATPase [Devosia sp. RR2S18]
MRKFPQIQAQGQDDEAPLREVIDVAGILAQQAVNQLIGKKLDHALEHQPGMVVLIEVPSDSWVTALRRQLNRDYTDVVVQGYRPGKRASSTAQEEDSLIVAQRGGSAVIAISTDVEGLVPVPLRTAADVSLKFSGLSRRSLRKAISEVTGKRARGIRAEDAALDLPELCAALRPRSQPADCLRRLRLAAKRQEIALVPDSTIPPVSELPLSPRVRAWSAELLVRLQQLEIGELTSRDAPFALLAGPPGTGKTLLAQAIARAAGWRFVGTSVKEWFELSDGHLGGVTRAAAEFFRQVEENGQTIGFIDELEALPDRRTLAPEHREWWNTVVTGVLLNIDKLRRSSKPLVLLAASNYPERVDAAVLRAGRIGQTLTVSPPGNREEVADLFRFYVGSHLAASELERVVDIAFAFGLPTPAAIAGWVGMAKSSAVAGSRQLTVQDLEHAMVGTDDRTYAELRRVAVHEAGHAIVAAVLGVPVSAVSLLKNGGSAGSMVSDLSALYLDRARIEDLVTIALAGRAADLELLGRCDAGARTDLAMATQLLVEAQFRSGLFDQLLSFDLDVSRLHELDLATRSGLEKRLQQLMLRSRGLVLENRHLIEALVQRLVARRVVSGEELRHIAGTEQDSAVEPAESGQLT